MDLNKIGKFISEERRKIILRSNSLIFLTLVTEQFPSGNAEVPIVKDTTPQPTLTQYCKETTFG